MQQGPSWETNSHSASQKISCISRNTKVHYRVQKRPPLVSILSQMHPVYTLPSYFPVIHSNILYPSMPRSSEWSLLFMSSDQKLCMHFSSIPCVLHTLPILSYYKWSLQVMKLLTAQSNLCLLLLIIRATYQKRPQQWISEAQRTDGRRRGRTTSCAETET
jgi:hypothetical protein